MTILVTGANGFVGSNLISLLQEKDFQVRASCRTVCKDLPTGIEQVSVGDINANTDWTTALGGVDCIVHLAGLAHNKHIKTENPTQQYEVVNVSGAVNLAEQAVGAGIKRFVFVSTIGVHGSATHNHAITEDSPFDPQTEYANSKLIAEKKLIKLASDTDLELVIVRPPLVYGKNAPGNLARLANLLAKGLPLPFANIGNRRSLVFKNNLSDFLSVCVSHPRAANETFLISDDDDLSTGEICNLLSKSRGRKARLFYLPQILLRTIFRVLGKSGLESQLLSSLEVDSNKAKTKLDWIPKFHPRNVVW